MGGAYLDSQPKGFGYKGGIGAYGKGTSMLNVPARRIPFTSS